MSAGVSDGVCWLGVTEDTATTTHKPRPRCGLYELLVRIGKGGMASVYLARSEIGELVALKVLHPHLGQQPELVDMLMDEARIASQLHHPNVVRTLDIGRDAERYYLVMEYVEGVALDRLLRRSEDARPELIVPLAIDALRGLSAAHRLTDEVGRPLELVHRDVTPGNVIVGADGVARIADFGVAKARARITKTMPGIVKGKAGYVAPEVVLGRPDIDGRADVFSMGVLLYNALTGVTLFDADDLASTLTQLLEHDPSAPSTVGRRPAPIFDAPILGALHRDPEFRHIDALEMADALEDALIVYGDRGREPIRAWVRDAFGAQLGQRRRLAGGNDEVDPESAEPISTSGMIRRDPTGERVVIPEHFLDDDKPALAPKRPWLRKALIIAGAAIALLAAGLIGAWIATAG